MVLRGVGVPAKVLEGGYLNEGALEYFWREYMAFFGLVRVLVYLLEKRKKRSRRFIGRYKLYLLLRKKTKFPCGQILI